MNSDVFLPGAEPIFLEGGKLGCLLLHGAGGGTTWDLKEFTNYLHSQINATVSVPALRGFGTKPEDLYEVTFEDWMDDGKVALHRLQASCTSIAIIGHSFGGLLALILTAQNSSINAVITWAAVYKIKDKRLALLPIITKLPLINRVVPEKFFMTLSDEILDAGWVGYEWMPVSIVHALTEGIAKLKKHISDVTCPTFIIQGTIDEEITKDSPYAIYQKIKSKNKEIWLIEGAHHPLMLESQYKKELFERTLLFIQKTTILD